MPREILENRIRKIQAAISYDADGNEVARLLDTIKRYLLGVWELESDFTEYLWLKNSRINFENIVHSPTIANELYRRIQLLTGYQFASAKRVMDFLLAGIRSQEPLLPTRRQVALLHILNENPEISIGVLAREIGSTPRTVKQEKNVLFERHGVHIAAAIDPHFFQLAHYYAHFQAKSSSALRNFEKWLLFNDQAQEKFPFLLGFALEVDQQHGFFTLYVPNQQNHLLAFEKTIAQLEDQFLDYIKVHRALGYYVNTSFAWYDYGSRQWTLKADLHTVGTLQFIIEHGNQFPQPRGFIYGNKPIKFDSIDWIIAACNTGFPLTNEELCNILAKQGYPITEKSKCAREKVLKKIGAFFPYLGFSALAFHNFLYCFIICSQQSITILLQIVEQLPLSRLHPTENGAILVLGIPQEGPSFVKHLTQTLLHLPGIKDFIILRCEQDIPLVPNPSTTHLWNAKTQFWTDAKQK
ncbi:MAG: hypothetical protein ACFFDP_01145 [Promethearchaeota archaeon]